MEIRLRIPSPLSVMFTSLFIHYTLLWEVTCFHTEAQLSLGSIQTPAPGCPGHTEPTDDGRNISYYIYMPHVEVLTLRAREAY